MLPEIGTIEIADCLVYDPDSVEDYVAKLQATIADLRAKLGERDCQLNQKLNRSKHDPV